MRTPSRTTCLLLAIVLVPLGIVPLGAADEGITSSDHIITRGDGAQIHFTVHKPASASATEPTALILHSHGWSGSRNTDAGGDVGKMLDAGYGVLSFDARGHGDSGGLATIHHKDAEVGDTQAIIDWAHDNLAWVIKDSGTGQAKDIRIGAIGGSYGGAFQTTAATYDGRFDALVPQMTWNDLRQSLAPNGVIKSSWVDVLYAAGVALVDMDPRIHQWYAEGMATNSLPQAALDHLVGSNPDMAQANVPTLFVQGMPDLLFNYNEAYRNYQRALWSGAETALVTYNGGHILPGVQPVGFMGPARGGEPCGAYGDLALTWFDKHLRGNASADVPTGVSFALEDGTCVANVDVTSNDIPWANQTISLAALTLPTQEASLLLPLDAPAGTLAGTPGITGTLVGAGDRIHFFSLVVRDGDTGRIHVIDDQVTPYRSDAIGESWFGVQFGGIATKLDANDELFLRIDAQNEWFATNGARTPGVSLLLDAELVLPYLIDA